MRQLLTWCGTRALGDKPSFSSADSHAKLAAREIQQQLLKDFSVKSELSDWFSRVSIFPLNSRNWVLKVLIERIHSSATNTATKPEEPLKPEPNSRPRAENSSVRPSSYSPCHENADHVLYRLQDERQTWERLLQPASAPLLSPFPAELQNPHTAISTSLLSSPSQLTALSTLQSFYPPPNSSDTPTQPQPQQQQPSSSSTLLATTSTRIQGIASNLEFEIDKFAENVHTLDQFQQGADHVAAGILAMSAEALEERERLGKEKERENAGLEEGEGEIGTRDVLRGLSRVMDR